MSNQPNTTAEFHMWMQGMADAVGAAPRPSKEQWAKIVATTASVNDLKRATELKILRGDLGPK